MSSLNQFNNPYFNKGQQKKSPHVLDLRKIVDGDPQEQENQEMFKLERAKKFSLLGSFKNLFTWNKNVAAEQVKKASKIKNKCKDSIKSSLDKRKEKVSQNKKLIKKGILATKKKTKKAIDYIEQNGQKIEKDFIEKTNIPISFEDLQAKRRKEKGDLFIVGFRKNVKVLHGVDIKETLDELVLVSIVKFFGFLIYGVGKITYRSFVYVFVFFGLFFRIFSYAFEYFFITTGLQGFCRTRLPFLYDIKARLKLLLRDCRDIRIEKPKITFNQKVQKPKREPILSSSVFSWPVLKKFLRPVLSFAIVALVFVIPLRFLEYYKDIQDTKERVLGISEQAYSHLISAREATMNYDLGRAGSEFEAANQNFNKAQSELNQINIVLQNVVKLIPQKGDMLTSAQNLLEAGEIISEIGAKAGKSIESLLSESVANENLNQKLKIIKADLETIKPQVNKAADLLNNVNEEFIPFSQREEFLKTRNQFILFNESLNRFWRLSDVWLEVLGEDFKKRYLIIFQNNNEIRPTGGFMGSLALVDIYQGDIKKIEIPGGGPYDFKGSLLARVKAPEPFHLLSSRWQFQDANWFPDFPESAKKIMWFYEKSGGSTVDGVIGLNASLFVDLLKITGPIEMADYGKTINADNFILETQKTVELEYDKEENKPKKFIADLTPIMLEKLLNSKSDKFVEIMTAFVDAASQKDILCYLNDPENQENIIELGWGGEIKDNEGDYLSVVNTNIAGGKTDGVIDQEIKHEVEIEDDGTAIASVIITRKHNGAPGDLFTGDRNVNYTRIYVPKGSILLEAGGFDKPSSELFKEEMDELEDDYDLRRIERQVKYDPATGVRISEQFNKTVFGHWTQVYPGKSATLSFRYKLPFKIENKNKQDEPTGIFAYPILEDIYKKYFSTESSYSSYSLLLQKQPGTNNDKFFSNIIFPIDWRGVWASSEKIIQRDNEILIDDVIIQDQSYGVIWRR